jgi:hypothetical protein
MGDWHFHSIGLRAKCANCGADREVSTIFVLNHFGPEHRFNEARDIPRITKHLTCGTCGAKGTASVKVVKG